MPRIVFIYSAEVASSGQKLLELLNPVASRLDLSLESYEEAESWRAALERCRAEGEVVIVLISAAARQAVSIGRLAHRIVPDGFILFAAAPEEEVSIRQQLGMTPMLGLHWAFALPEAQQLENALLEARKATQQRRSVQTTIRRVGQQLAAPRGRVETRFRREMLGDRFLTSVLAHGFDAVVCFGEERQVLTWNSAAERIFGIPEITVGGRTVEDLASEPSLFSVVELVRRSYDTKMVIRHEMRHLRTDGSTVDLEATITPVRDEAGGTAGAVLIARDVTERVRAEREALLARDEAERANRAKDRFLAVLSHELRTPLTPVLALLDSLNSRDNLPMDLRSDLQLIRRNVLLEARLVDDLLDINRISKGKLQLHVELIDIHRTIEYAKDICRPDAVTKQIQLVSDFHATHHQVCGDLARVQQIFWNLIQNAVKFTPSKGMITVRTRNPAQDRIEVSVQDTGVGIAPEVLPRIFDPFEQGTKAVTRQFGGLGLGLAICKALVDAHGGTIFASSAGRNQGTTFTVTLKLAAEDECTAPSAPVRDAESLRKGLLILLVEDHEDTRGTLQRLLARRGHKVQTASNVAEALRIGTECDFDLLITDIGLPDATGHDLMREISKLCRRIRGIALSGFGMEEDIAASKEAGFSDHLTKPINFQKLEEAIYRCAAEMEGGNQGLL